MKRVEDVPLIGAPAECEPAGAFDEFYVAAYAPMVRLAWAMLDRRDLAEEVVQDAFAAVYPRFDGLHEPGAYLRTCVMNKCRQALRRRRVARRRSDVEQPAAVEDYHDHLFDVIRRLPARQRAVVVLRYQQGLGEREIADTLGMAPGTVKSCLSRAKDRLRKELS
jgi:RNA polymerase sigma-70 factor (sigma-E family)